MITVCIKHLFGQGACTPRRTTAEVTKKPGREGRPPDSRALLVVKMRLDVERRRAVGPRSSASRVAGDQREHPAVLRSSSRCVSAAAAVAAGSRACHTTANKQSLPENLPHRTNSAPFGPGDISSATSGPSPRGPGACAAPSVVVDVLNVRPPASMMITLSELMSTERQRAESARERRARRSSKVATSSSDEGQQWVTLYEARAAQIKARGQPQLSNMFAGGSTTLHNSTRPQQCAALVRNKAARRRRSASNHCSRQGPALRNDGAPKRWPPPAPGSTDERAAWWRRRRRLRRRPGDGAAVTEAWVDFAVGNDKRCQFNMTQAHFTRTARSRTSC